MCYDVTFREATADDLTVIETLLRAAALPLEGIEAHLPGFVLAHRDQEVVGLAGTERYGAYGLLRSVTVRSDQRGQGKGQALTSELIRRAHDAGLSGLFLLSTAAERFFPKFGFTPITRGDLPPGLFASQELQGVCPASAVVMHLALQPTQAGIPR
ncbi:arsenic resistance N-acetyltransferase ArsN2 [Deinococcus sp. QL22]|uniref:arsenic resistance N-acetyltransferase ArsN2 n=1 Tax=Deinococcus sp. QL22 TaxID=2939437 RepID=UPI0020177C9A|nr:arsenic resistance N-acetyltransferase ArsN2 [Deinococcus sp. QL22]UQN09421.1 arsenic resistance N-acetyltransferase ArsN2 [Deinococcus sp. QL22]